MRERASLFIPFRSWRLQVLAVALAVAAAIVSAQSFASAREAATSYLIQPGDSLLAISTITGVSLDRLISVNNINNPDFIVAGQTLSLDGSAQPTVNGPVQATRTAAAPTSVDQSASTQYTIRTGDTLWDIAQANGISVDSLIKLNNVADVDNLTVGQSLRLPATAVSQRSASSAAPVKTTPTPVALIKRQSTPVSSPSPSPTAVPAVGTLQQRIAAEAVRLGGPNVHVGAAASNLVTGERLIWHADDAFPSASVMKLPILVELERQIAAGKLSWTDSLRAEASAMIAVSDNTAANQIADAIHPQSVNDTLSRLGLNGTKFFNLFSDTRSAASPGMNQTTPANMARLLEMIATDQIVSPQVSADIRALLAHNTDRSKLARLLPADATIAHKSGWYDGVANDVGIVTVDRVPTRWTIAVLAENIPDAETGNQINAAISKLVYDAWGK